MNDSKCAGEFATRVQAAQWAVREFTAQRVPEEVNLGLYVFDTNSHRERVPLGKGNRGQILTQIDRIQGGGNTPLNEALRVGVRALSVQRERQLGYGEFYVVVATDGAASDGDLATDGVAYALRQRVPIITIGFCLQGQHPLAQHSMSYRDANSPQQLLSALQETQGESTYFDQSVFPKQ